MLDMLSTIIKNLFSKPATRLYPYEQRESFEGTRGQVEGVDIQKCIFCGICERQCPSKAIKVNRKEQSWEIDKFKCIVCGLCSEVCPKKCIGMSQTYAQSTNKKWTLKCNKQRQD